MGIYKEVTPIQPPLSHRLHVVLVAPEVHWNTGNIGRTCLGAGAALHLVRPLGFSLDSRQVKRAGLDYWPEVDLKIWDDFNHFQDVMRPAEEEIALLSKGGSHPHWQIIPRQRLFLVFGSETRGLPPALLSGFAHRTFYIPITTRIRCLNLSTAVGIVLYESIHQIMDPLSM